MFPDLLQEFKVFLQIDPSDTGEDGFLTEILYGAEAFIYNYYGISILDRQVNEILKANYQNNTLFTKRGYIREIISLKYNDEDITDFSEFKLIENKIIFPDDYTLQQSDIIDITYKIGYLNITDVPKGLKTGLYIIGKKIYNDATKNTDTYSQISTGIRENVKFIDDLPIVADLLLSGYRCFRL